jgi:hypothetical protein
LPQQDVRSLPVTPNTRRLETNRFLGRGGRVAEPAHPEQDIGAYVVSIMVIGFQPDARIGFFEGFAFRTPLEEAKCQDRMRPAAVGIGRERLPGLLLRDVGTMRLQELDRCREVPVGRGG